MKVLFWMFIGFDKHTTSEHLMTAIIEQLCKHGHSVHVIQKSTGGTLPPIPDSLSGYSVSTDVIFFQDADKRNFVARYLKEKQYINECKKFLKKDFDAVFIQSTTVCGFAVRAVRKKIPNAIITFNVQDIFPYNAVYSGSIKRNGLLFKLLSSLQRYGYKNSDHIITISNDMKETLVSDGINADKIQVIYNWSYNDELYRNLDLSLVSNLINPSYFNVVYAGNIGVMQNVDLIIESANLLKNEKDIWFHIIGNGVYKDKLLLLANKYEIDNISFWPMQSPDLAPYIYSAADVNVIPLVKDVYRTALPSKTATCLACEKPIIFAIGKNSEFEKDLNGTGCLFIDSDDAVGLKNNILYLRNSNTRKICSANVYSQLFSVTKNSNIYSQIITSSER